MPAACLLLQTSRQWVLVHSIDLWTGDIVCNGTAQWGKNPLQLACNKTHPWYYPESLGFTHNEWWNIVCVCGVCGLFSWCSVLSNVCPAYSIRATRHRRCSRLIDQNWFSSVWPEQVSFWLFPPLLATHNASKVQGGKAPVIPLPTSSLQPELAF